MIAGAPLVLLLAMLLDAILGEPRWLWARAPHPAVLMGRAVGRADAWLNRGARRKAAGMLALAGLVTGAGAFGWALQALIPTRAADVVILAVLLAQKSLVEHVRAVAVALREGTAPGRRAVAMIVGRDTAAMEPPDIARAAIESAAENLSDGVIAPAFWYLVGGLPGLMIYKIANTADSMIGHRTPRHAEFGWAAARFDDLLNLIPARLTALLILAPRGRLSALCEVSREARRHRSPNAGWPEAAMARCLDVALSGPRSYDGARQDFPYIHPDGCRNPGPEAIGRATAVLWSSWAAFLLLVALLEACP
ncbi:MAG: adenosylcobinamide-phosphate synthase CbiB [Tropicimonas sp.]|uniref:adenosylcobinamide-phosphate synthase CbiB n=1 Tax=Tropicimonas sp. TaxID=2067044 RepID=UPI003A89FF18